MIQLICSTTERQLEIFENEDEAKNKAGELLSKGYGCYIRGDGWRYSLRNWGQEQGFKSDWNAFITWKPASDYYDSLALEKAHGSETSIELGQKNKQGNEVVKVNRKTFVVLCSKTYLKHAYLEVMNDSFNTKDGKWYLTLPKEYLYTKPFK